MCVWGNQVCFPPPLNQALSLQYPRGMLYIPGEADCPTSGIVSFFMTDSTRMCSACFDCSDQ